MPTVSIAFTSIVQILAAIILGIFSAFTNYVVKECVVVLTTKRFYFDAYAK